MCLHSLCIELYNHFDIQTIVPTNSGHILIFSNQIVLLNGESEYPLNLGEYGIEMEDVVDTYFEEDNFYLIIANEDLEEDNESCEDSVSSEEEDDKLVQLHKKTTAIHVESIEGIEIKPFRNKEEFDFLHVDGWYCTGVFRLEKDAKFICNDYGLVFLNWFFLKY